MQSQRSTQGRGLLKQVVWGLKDKKCSSWGYVGKIIVNPRHEEVRL